MSTMAIKISDHQLFPVIIMTLRYAAYLQDKVTIVSTKKCTIGCGSSLCGLHYTDLIIEKLEITLSEIIQQSQGLLDSCKYTTHIGIVTIN